MFVRLNIIVNFFPTLSLFSFQMKPRIRQKQGDTGSQTASASSPSSPTATSVSSSVSSASYSSSSTFQRLSNNSFEEDDMQRSEEKVLKRYHRSRGSSSMMGSSGSLVLALVLALTVSSTVLAQESLFQCPRGKKNKSCVILQCSCKMVFVRKVCMFS